MPIRHRSSSRHRLVALALVGAVGIVGCARPAAGTAPVSTSAPSSSLSSSPASSSALPLAGASSVASGEQGVPAAPLAACTADTLSTRTPGVLTIATGSAPSAPWFVGYPAGGQGLEAAVAASVAEGLGYDSGTIRWVEADRTTALAGRTDTFDLDLDRFSATELTGAPVDASSGYFADADTVLVPAGSPTDPTLAALSAVRTLELAAADGSTVAARDGGVLATAGIVADLASATAALQDGTTGGVVLPLTDAVAAAAADPAVRVLGQVPPGAVQPDQLVALLAPGSTLTPCVSAVFDRLRVEGTLEQLAQTWVPVPVLR